MKEILAGGSVFVLVLSIAAFVFAVVMQPIFVWIICARLRRTNDLLQRIERKTSAPQMQPRR